MASVEAPLLAASANPVATELLQAAAAEVAATVVSDLALEAKPTLEETTPRAILQIRSDIQEGLKAVFDRLVQATGTELLQTMAEAGPLADKIVAQALIADMIDETQLNGLPMPDNGDATDKTPPIATALPVSPSTEAVADAVPALLLAMVEPAEDIPEPAQTVILPQPSATPPGLAVGFITTPYAPAEDVVKSKDPLRIDRVDAVDDDEHEEPGSQQQQAGQHDEPETPAEAALDMLSAEPDTAIALTEEPPPSRSSLIALPHHTPAEPLPNPGYDLYERMGA